MEIGLVEYVNIDNMIIKFSYILIYPESSFRCLILALGGGVMRCGAPPPGLFRARRGASEGGIRYTAILKVSRPCVWRWRFWLVFFDGYEIHLLK